MPAKPPKLLIVDTNCYVRLYLSPVRPILGSIFGGYKLVTLTELHIESGAGTRVSTQYPFLQTEEIQNELKQACLTIREPKKSRIEKGIPAVQRMGNRHLSVYCKATNRKEVRELSRADTRLYVTADELDAGLATDEWPLRLVASRLGTGEHLFDTLDLLRLMETSLAITPDQRRETVRLWRLYGEHLPDGWETRYGEFFGEPPPDGQAPRSQSA